VHFTRFVTSAWDRINVADYRAHNKADKKDHFKNGVNPGQYMPNLQSSRGSILQHSLRRKIGLYTEKSNIKNENAE